MCRNSSKAERVPNAVQPALERTRGEAGYFRRARVAAGRSARGHWATKRMKLRLDDRIAVPTRSPDGADDDVVLIEGIVEMAGQFSEVEAPQCWDTSNGLRCPSPRKERQNSEGLLEFGSEDLAMESVLQPPSLLARDVPLRGRGEPNTARPQADLSSFRIESASTRRPAATSASESRKAACNAARSTSSSQSPGSSGRSSTSVPSGRSVGSSTTSRPAQTRAFRVMTRTLAFETSPNKPFERPGKRAVCRDRVSEVAGRSAPDR
jgi:hypothetical protein